MRGKILLAAAVFLLGSCIASLWTDSRAVPWVPAAVAQEAKKAEGTTNAKVEPSLEARLNQRIDIDFKDTPLSDAVAYLQEQSGIQFVINAKKLDEAGVSVDAPVNKSLKRVRLTTALELILDELELAYLEKDELLVITTPEDAESKLVIRVYDCRDLIALDPPELQKIAPPTSGSKAPANTTPLPPADTRPALAPPAEPAKPKTPTRFPAPPPPGQPALPQLGGSLGTGGGEKQGRVPSGGAGCAEQSEYDRRAGSLIELIENTVDVDTWDTMGGVGAIQHYSGLIVVTQTSQTHKKVERVLDMLRYAAGFAGPLGENVVR